MTFKERITKFGVNLSGFKYKIKFNPTLLDKFSVAGVTGVFTGDMELDSTCTKNDMISTIIHESIEVMLRKNEIHVEHETITKLENILFRYFGDNKKLLQLLIRNIDEKKEKTK